MIRKSAIHNMAGSDQLLLLNSAAAVASVMLLPERRSVLQCSSCWSDRCDRACDRPDQEEEVHARHPASPDHTTIRAAKLISWTVILQQHKHAKLLQTFVFQNQAIGLQEENILRDE